MLYKDTQDQLRILGLRWNSEKDDYMLAYRKDGDNENKGERNQQVWYLAQQLNKQNALEGWKSPFKFISEFKKNMMQKDVDTNEPGKPQKHGPTREADRAWREVEEDDECDECPEYFTRVV